MKPQTSSQPEVLKIACVDVLAPEVQEQTRAIAAPDFEIRFTRSTEPAVLHEILADADFMLLGATQITASLLQHSPKLRLIQKYGVGLDKVDLDAVRRAKVPFAVAAGGNAPPVSELCLGLMIAVNRRMLYGDSQTRKGNWVQVEMRSSCLQIDGMTVGLLGFGAIARLTARRLAGFDCEILYHSRTRADAETEHQYRVKYVSQDELLERSDILSLHVPLNATTRHMINAETLGKMKPSAILINTSRGAIIDDAALYDALTTGRLRGAGLDVFHTEPAPADLPLFQLDNVVVMPHAGGAAFNNVGRVMRHAIGNMRKFRDGQPLPAADVIVPPAAA